MSLSDKIEQTRRDFAAMRQSAQDARATLDEVQEAARKLRADLRYSRLALWVNIFLLGALTTTMCNRYFGI